MPFERRPDSCCRSACFLHPGLDFPTPADLVAMVLIDAVMPFNKTIEVAGGTYDRKCPKLEALAKRTAEYPSVKTFLASDGCFLTNGL